MAAPLPERVLLVRLGAIGDVANALIVATAIKSAVPATRVGWAVHDLAAPLVTGHPDVDRVHVWRRGGGAEAYRAVLREIRGEGYGLAVDLQRIFKSALLARLSRARRVVGFDKARAKELSWLWTKERLPAGRRTSHMVLQYLEFVRYLGLSAFGAVHRFPESPAAEAYAQALLAELGQAPIVLNLGASKPENRWPAERFGRLARRLLDELAFPLVLTGGPGDTPLAARVLAELGNPRGLKDLVGATGLLELLEVLRRARLVVSCDTGPMHLAAAVQTPVVALFGPADPSRTGPFGEAHRVVRAPGVPGSMAEIAVDLVYSAVRETLDRQG
jgi:ADP-heptose:LPS heptosyltransferase